MNKVKTGAQASLLALSVRFGREKALLCSNLDGQRAFSRQKPTLIASRMLALQSVD